MASLHQKYKDEIVAYTQGKAWGKQCYGFTKTHKNSYQHGCWTSCK